MDGDAATAKQERRLLVGDARKVVIRSTEASAAASPSPALRATLFGLRTMSREGEQTPAEEQLYVQSLVSRQDQRVATCQATEAASGAAASAGRA